ncbi:AmmeMemoRadiSam system protein A [candidate division KSB1 bacterium]|jgi:AmmeMemoRadiSam system protein A|nr:AmmeMemoRadiSam system protein A [candidate division KSB1 bacterium]
MNESYSLDSLEQQTLLTLARQSIIAAVTNKSSSPVLKEPAERLAEKRGAFVTLHLEGQLKGCIGYIFAVKPLWQTVVEAASSAALRDPRFSPVETDQVDTLNIEISVLSPLQKIDDIEEIEIGRDGLLISQQGKSGLLLPQVAAEHHWDAKTFVEQTCRKAGLSRHAYLEQETELFTFSAQVFSEPV